jgi:probable rRNA maturation factor
MAVEVLNRQRRHDVDAARLAAVSEAALAAVGRAGADVSVTITNDRRLRELNGTYRGKDKPTDVLSFPYDDEGGPLGDVVISVDRALAQAAERGHSLQREAELLTLHGTLHVCGYDHETDGGEMDRIERRLRRRLLSPA